MILYVPIIIGVVVLIYLRIQEKRKLSSILEGFIDLRAFKRVLREESVFNGPVANLLLLNTILTISTAITYMVYTRLGYFNLSDIYPLFGIVLATLFGYYWIRKIIFVAMGYFTEQNAIAQEIQVYNKFFYQTIGIVLLPVISFLNYRLDNSTNDWISVFYNGTLLLMILLFVVVYFVKIVQEFRQTTQLKISGYYLFLYFCTLEILPLVALIMWFVGKFWGLDSNNLLETHNFFHSGD